MLEGAEKRRAALAGHAAMALFSLLVAGSFSLGSLIAGDLSPTALMILRFWLGSVIVATILIVTGKAASLRLVAPWRFLILGGIFASYFVAMFEALKIAGPVPLAAIFTLTPLMTGLLAWPILGQRLSAFVWGALLVGASGAVWVVFGADLAALSAFQMGKGEGIFLAGSLMHALYVPLLRKMNRGEGPLASTFGVLVGGGIVLLGYGWSDLAAVEWATLPARVWWVLAYLMIFATTTTFSLVQFAAMRLPSSKVMAYTYLVPSWVILWQLALGHAVPPVGVLAGVGLTLVALVMLLGRDT